MTTPFRFVIPILLLSGANVLGADPPPTMQHATALLRDGKRDEALRAFEAIIAARPPDPSDALFAIGTMELEDGNWKAAKPRVEQLMKLRPAFYPGWELMIQTYQAAGDPENRDAAIQSLYTAWHSALDPGIRSRVSFVRDRIFGSKHKLLAHETLEPGGEAILRFLFEPVDELGQQRHLIAVHSDNATNERWREDGTAPYGTIVYHLDTLQLLPNGRSLARPYAFYLEPPAYDKVRAKVVEILAGTIQPLSGSADPFWAGEPGGGQ